MPQDTDDKPMRRLALRHSNNRKQFSSLVLFLSVIIFVNLCPFDTDVDIDVDGVSKQPAKYVSQDSVQRPAEGYHLGLVDSCLSFVRLMFSSPLKMRKKETGYFQAEAKVIGKMVKMLYIKKKIKKFNKKLKKHTIAVPVFTAIPIYEHSYYPQPHVTHMTHGGLHHAASYYSPAVAPLSSHNQAMIASASNNHQQMAAYRMPEHHHLHHQAMYNPIHSAHQIINSYAPSPPLYVDDNGGLYGHYGNAYSRYDGGYHLW